MLTSKQIQSVMRMRQSLNDVAADISLKLPIGTTKKSRTKRKSMPEVTVQIIESERGWGQKVEETKKFKSRKKAEEFVKKYNKDNNKPAVPEIYWYAKIID